MSLMMVSMLFLQLSRALASSSRITDVLKTEIDLTDDNAECKDRQVTVGKVEFKNVYFKYYEKRKENVLENISFTAEAGEIVGIIGTTGSGKSSLVQLIPRLYDVTQGEVLVDGINVKDYSLRHLRDGVGMVLQKNVLFSGSIEDNLRWGNENATEEEIRGAAEAAQADGFVTSFNDGYNMELGQGGVNVSGGQKQRLCIARALLKKPKILILDDSTSAVDTATEAKIREAFSTSLKGSTKIIIAQRISSVIDADKIVVLEDGRIAGIGSHKELMESCGEYRDIYYSQIDKEKEVG
jgi:ATP-binding cassette subfamily B protein